MQQAEGKLSRNRSIYTSRTQTINAEHLRPWKIRMQWEDADKLYYLSAVAVDVQRKRVLIASVVLLTRVSGICRGDIVYKGVVPCKSNF